MSSDNDARPTSFPQDIASCHAMLEGVFQSMAEKDKRIGELEDVVKALIEERYARISVRRDQPSQWLVDSPQHASELVVPDGGHGGDSLRMDGQPNSSREVDWHGCDGSSRLGSWRGPGSQRNDLDLLWAAGGLPLLDLRLLADRRR